MLMNDAGGWLMIRVDLHVHTKVSKNFLFRESEFNRTVAEAKKRGLNGFAAIEHFHAANFWDTNEKLARRFPYENGRFNIASGFNVLTGAELTTADKSDIVLLGPIDALQWLDRQFGKLLSQGHHPFLREVVEPAHQAGIIMIGAHPTRGEKNLLGVDEQTTSQLDALEVNGKDVAKGQAHKAVSEWAARLGRPIVGGSDTHVWSQIGAQRTLLPGDELTFEALRTAIFEGKTQVESMPHTAQVVRLSQLYKKIWKRCLKVGQEPALLPRPSMAWAIA
jgi:hypothetical protein